VSTRFADRVICVHHLHKEVLIGRGVPATKITILLNVPDPKLFGSEMISVNNDGELIRLVYHGMIATRLGLDIAVDAFYKSLEVIPNARFNIYGAGDFADQLEQKIQKMSLGDRIFYSKKAFRVDQIPNIVKGATLGIVPNRKDLATEYMLPVKLLDFLYLGVPVIAPRLKRYNIILTRNRLDIMNVIIRRTWQESLLSYAQTKRNE